MRIGITGLLMLGVVASGCAFEYDNPAELLAPGQLTGRILRSGAEGPVPSEGVSVTLGATQRRAKSGADGTFAFVGLPGGTYELTASSGALAVQLAGLRVPDDDGVHVGDLLLVDAGSARGQVRLEGRGLDENAGVQVVIAGDAEVSLSAATGEVTVPFLPAGPTEFVAHHPGFRPLRIPVEIDPGQETDFALVELSETDGSERGLVFGKVLLERSEGVNDFAGTTVSLLAIDGQRFDAVGETASDGAFTVDEVPVGVYTLLARRSGYIDAAVPNIIVFGGATGGDAVPQIVLAAQSGDCDGDGQADGADDDDDDDGVPDADEAPECVCAPAGRRYDTEAGACLPELRNRNDASDRVPVARFVANTDAPYGVGRPLRLDASGSFDPDGSTLSYAWRVRGPAGQSPALGTTASTEWTPDAAGLWLVTLSVSDGVNTSLPALRRFEAEVLNSAPTAVLVVRDTEGGVIEANGEVLAGALSVFDAGGSSDPDEEDPAELNFVFCLACEHCEVRAGTQRCAGSAAPADPPSPCVGLLQQSNDAPPWEKVLLTTVPGEYTVEVAVDDGFEESRADAGITVLEANTSPVLVAPEVQVVEPGSRLSFVVSATDAEDDPVALRMEGDPGLESFSPETGVFDWTPEVEQVGEHTVTFFASDGTNEVSASTLIIVTLSNQAPLIEVSPPLFMVPGQSYAFTLSASDPEGQPVSLSVDDLPATALLDLESGNGSWTPGEGDIGFHPVTISASDGVKTSRRPLFLTVLDEPEAPRAAPPPAGRFSTLEAVRYRVLASDSGGNAVTFTALDPLPEGASLDPATGLVSAAPGAVAVGTYVFRIQASSANGNITEVASFTVVEETLVADAGRDVHTGAATFTLDASGSMNLAPEPEPLSFSWSLVEAAYLSEIGAFNAETAIAEFTPDVLGRYVFEVTVSDGANSATDLVTFTQTNGDCVIFSEVGENFDPPAWIEIYNCGDSVVDLSTYGVCFAFGSGCRYQVALRDALAPGETFLLCDNVHSGLPEGVSCDMNTSWVQRAEQVRLGLWHDVSGDNNYSVWAGDVLMDALGNLDIDFAGRPFGYRTLRRCDLTPYPSAIDDFELERLWNSYPSEDLSDAGLPPSEAGCGVQVSRPSAIIHGPVDSLVGQGLRLDAVGSSDPEGYSLSFTWSLRSVPAGSTTTLELSNPVAPVLRLDATQGEYEIRLDVEDASGGKSSDIHTLKTWDFGREKCLIVTEIHSGGGWNSALELYNCGATELDLDDLWLMGGNSGPGFGAGGAGFSAHLVAPGGTFTVCERNFDQGLLPEGAGCDTSNNIGDVVRSVGLNLNLDTGGTWVPEYLTDAVGAATPAGTSRRRCNPRPFVWERPYVLDDYFVSEAFGDFSDFGAFTPPAGCP